MASGEWTDVQILGGEVPQLGLYDCIATQAGSGSSLFAGITPWSLPAGSATSMLNVWCPDGAEVKQRPSLASVYTDYTNISSPASSNPAGLTRLADSDGNPYCVFVCGSSTRWGNSSSVSSITSPAVSAPYAWVQDVWCQPLGNCSVYSSNASTGTAAAAAVWLVFVGAATFGSVGTSTYTVTPANDQFSVLVNGTYTFAGTLTNGVRTPAQIASDINGFASAPAGGTLTAFVIENSIVLVAGEASPASGTVLLINAPANNCNALLGLTAASYAYQPRALAIEPHAEAQKANGNWMAGVKPMAYSNGRLFIGVGNVLTFSDATANPNVNLVEQASYPADNYLYIGNTGDSFTNTYAYNDYVYVFTQTRIYRVDAKLPTTSEEIFSDMGADAFSVVGRQGLVFFRYNGRIWMWNIGVDEPRDINYDQGSLSRVSTQMQPSAQTLDMLPYAIDSKRKLLHIANINSSVAQYELVYDYRNDRFYQWKYSNNVYPVSGAYMETGISSSYEKDMVFLLRDNSGSSKGQVAYTVFDGVASCDQFCFTIGQLSASAIACEYQPFFVGQSNSYMLVKNAYTNLNSASYAVTIDAIAYSSSNTATVAQTRTIAAGTLGQAVSNFAYPKAKMIALRYSWVSNTTNGQAPVISSIIMRNQAIHQGEDTRVLF